MTDRTSATGRPRGLPPKPGEARPASGSPRRFPACATGGCLFLSSLLAAAPVRAELFSCEGVTRPDARAVVSMDETAITVNGVPYVIEGADARFVYARLDAERAGPIQRDYFPNRSVAVDLAQGRLIEFKDQDRSFEEGNTVEWSCRSVKAWTGDPE